MTAGRPPLWNKPRTKRDRAATAEQSAAWHKLKPGDVIRIRLRTGNVQRFIVKELPAEFRPEPGTVHAVKMGAGNTPYRRISAFELVIGD